MTNPHQHNFVREDGRASFSCACGQTRQAPPMAASLPAYQAGSHASTGTEHDAYLHSLMANITHNDFRDAYLRHTNADAIEILNVLLAARHRATARGACPGISTEHELRRLGDFYGVPRKHDGATGPRPQSHTRRETGTPDMAWKRYWKP